MSTESHTAHNRAYRKRRRAELEDETRRRITEAAVELHGSIGPARTTISAVAERAGVQRATVYRHFPDGRSLFAACSGHYMAQNPLPDPAGWAAIDDPGERLRVALRDLYDWYGRNEQMVETTTRDEALVPALRPSMEGLHLYQESAAAVLAGGRSERGARRRRIGAAIGHAMAFETWRSLVRRQGLARDQAIALMLALVDRA